MGIHRPATLFSLVYRETKSNGEKHHCRVLFDTGVHPQTKPSLASGLKLFFLRDLRTQPHTKNPSKSAFKKAPSPFLQGSKRIGRNSTQQADSIRTLFKGSQKDISSCARVPSISMIPLRYPGCGLYKSSWSQPQSFGTPRCEGPFRINA